MPLNIKSKEKYYKITPFKIIPSKLKQIFETGCYIYTPKFVFTENDHDNIVEHVRKWLQEKGFQCQKEVPIEVLIPVDNKMVSISGRIDIVCEKDESIHVFEVKSYSNVTKADLVQLALYAYGVNMKKEKSTVKAFIVYPKINHSNDFIVMPILQDTIASLYFEAMEVLKHLVNQNYILRPGPYCKKCKHYNRCPLISRS